jgi:hypothetical protein
MSRQLWARSSVFMVGGFALGLIASLGALALLRSDEPDTTSSLAAAMNEEVELSESALQQDEPEPTSTPDPDSAPDTPGGIDGCRNALALGDEAVQAATTSLANWRAHYGAQLAFDRGEIDSEEAKRRWAESKAPAADDLAAYDDARTAFTADDGCAELDADALDADVRAEVSACQARAREIADVLVAAERSTEDWRGHLDMMARKDEFPIDEYLQIWTDTVARAPGPMRAFLDAVDGLADVPPCDQGDDDGAARGDRAPRTVATLRTSGPRVAPSPRTVGSCVLVSGPVVAS